MCHRTLSNNGEMKNAKWKMTNDPVATARGSDTPHLQTCTRAFTSWLSIYAAQ